MDAATFAAWGADFVKLDSCGGVLGPTWVMSLGRPVRRWSAAMNKTGRPMVFSCSGRAHAVRGEEHTGRLESNAARPVENGYRRYLPYVALRR